MPELSKTCAVCGTQWKMQIPDFPGYQSLMDQIRVCTACSDRHEREQLTVAAVARAAARRDAWHRQCPPTFSEFDAGKLPDRQAYARVMEWQHGPLGLILHGPTGTGKTRCAWALLRREWEAGRNFLKLDSGSGFAFAAKFSSGSDAVDRWIGDLSRVPILFLDDVFKSKLTDSFETALFAIIDERSEQQRPNILTLNDTGDTLTQRMTADRGEPTIRRLREFATQISFAGKPPNRP